MDARAGRRVRPSPPPPEWIIAVSDVLGTVFYSTNVAELARNGLFLSQCATNVIYFLVLIVAFFEKKVVIELL